MDLDRFLQNIEIQRAIDEGEREEDVLYTADEYDNLIVAAMNGGLIPEVETLDTPDGEELVVPEELMDWLHFCDYIKTGSTLIHLVLAGVIVPTQPDQLDSNRGYVYRKTDAADIILEDFGKGDYPK